MTTYICDKAICYWVKSDDEVAYESVSVDNMIEIKPEAFTFSCDGIGYLALNECTIFNPILPATNPIPPTIIRKIRRKINYRFRRQNYRKYI